MTEASLLMFTRMFQCVYDQLVQVMLPSIEATAVFLKYFHIKTSRARLYRSLSVDLPGVTKAEHANYIHTWVRSSVRSLRIACTLPMHAHISVLVYSVNAQHEFEYSNPVLFLGCISILFHVHLHQESSLSSRRLEKLKAGRGFCIGGLDRST